MCALSSSLMPMPWSITEISTWKVYHSILLYSHSIVMTPASAENLIALEIKLNKIWVVRIRSISSSKSLQKKTTLILMSLSTAYDFIMDVAFYTTFFSETRSSYGAKDLWSSMLLSSRNLIQKSKIFEVDQISSALSLQLILVAFNNTSSLAKVPIHLMGVTSS